MKRIGVFTSGGDAPGMNACIRAVVRTCLYYDIEVFGITRGYEGMIHNQIAPIDGSSVSNIIQKGGTILKSARSMQFIEPAGREIAFENLKKNNIDGLVAIGGNGTFTGAMKLFNEHGIPVVGAPGTIDNDLFGTDYTIGYDTAVNTALEAIDKIRDTADAHDRVFFIEVMGRDTGYIAVRSGIGGGAEMVLMPEMNIEVDEVINKLKASSSNTKSSHVIIVAEGSSAGKASDIANKVKFALPELDTKVTTLGHIQRGGAPTASDRVLASRLGHGSVEALLNGKTNVMTGIINGDIVYTSLEEAITIRKEINPELSKMVDILSGRKTAKSNA